MEDSSVGGVEGAEQVRLAAANLKRPPGEMKWYDLLGNYDATLLAHHKSLESRGLGQGPRLSWLRQEIELRLQRAEPGTDLRQHPLRFGHRPKGKLAEVLELTPAEMRLIERMVHEAVESNWNMKQLIEEVGAMNIRDEVWAVFLYTYGWWDHARRT